MKLKIGKRGYMFEERDLDVLGLSETKIKGEGDIRFGEIRGLKIGLK